MTVDSRKIKILNLSSPTGKLRANPLRRKVIAKIPLGINPVRRVRKLMTRLQMLVKMGKITL
jgi:hypothetical protein